MLREISEEVRINVKDRLRDIRHAIRQRRHDSGRTGLLPDVGMPVPFPLRGIEGLLGHAVSAFDDAMSVAETLVPYTGHAMPGPKPFETYFPAGPDALAGERAFRRDMYHMTRAMLTRRVGGAGRLQESSFAAVHAAMLRRHGGLAAELRHAAGETERLSLTAQMASELLVELLRQHPLRLDAAAAGRPIECESLLSVLGPAALACGLASAGADDPDLLRTAALAVESRLDRIEAACRSPDPVAELTPVFAMLIFHPG